MADDVPNSRDKFHAGFFPPSSSSSFVRSVVRSFVCSSISFVPRNNNLISRTKTKTESASKLVVFVKSVGS